MKATGKKRGILDKIYFGSEKSETYARNSLPSNRWELFWDVFKNSFWRLCLVNLLMLLSLLPLFALLIFRYMIKGSLGNAVPFAQCFGVGYFAPSSLIGFDENIAFNANLLAFVFLPLVAAIGALGISGGAYVIRNMVWTEGIFVANDFWKGIKQNYKQIFLVLLVYSLFLYLGIVVISLIDELITTNIGLKWLLIIGKIVSILVIAIISIMVLHQITMSVTYELSFFGLVKNSFLFTIGLFVQNIIFILAMAIPIILIYLGSFFMVIGILIFILFGISYMLLCWTDYCHWIYDKFINDKISGAKKNRGIYAKITESDSGALKKYKEQMDSFGSSMYARRPIKPITDEELTIEDLPESFSRSDLEKLNESKKALYEDNLKYIEEHKDDERYKVFIEEDKEKKLSDVEKRVMQAKKELLKSEKQKKRKK